MPSLKNSPPQDDGQKKWVVVQLSTTAERENDLTTIKRSVKRYLGKDLQVFIPAASLSVREDSHVMFYMDGYIFIEYVTGINYTKLNETTYFASVLTHPKTGYSCIPDSEIETLRKGVEAMKIGKFRVGDEVTILKGNYKNMRGRIKQVYDGDESYQVDIGLGSKPILADYWASWLAKI